LLQFAIAIDEKSKSDLLTEMEAGWGVVGGGLLTVGQEMPIFMRIEESSVV
jgi:hypothetical protein